MLTPPTTNGYVPSVTSSTRGAPALAAVAGSAMPLAPVVGAVVVDVTSGADPAVELRGRRSALEPALQLGEGGLQLLAHRHDGRADEGGLSEHGGGGVVAVVDAVCPLRQDRPDPLGRTAQARRGLLLQPEPGVLRPQDVELLPQCLQLLHQLAPPSHAASGPSTRPGAVPGNPARANRGRTIGTGAEPGKGPPAPRREQRPPGGRHGGTGLIGRWAPCTLLVLLLGGTASCGPDRPPETAPTAPDGDRWRPAPGLSWQWQLQGEIDTEVDADVFELDLDGPSDAVLAELRAQGRALVCYVNAGAFEPSRADAGRYPVRLLGGALEGWPDERWLDVRRSDLLAPILLDRIDRCAARGFDGVEFDNVDGYLHDTGFPLTEEHLVSYVRFLTRAAHERGLAVGLKNALELVPRLVDEVDFAVNESCAAFGECDRLAPFVERGKAVFHAEYDLPVEAFCPEARALGLSSIRKRRTLDAWREVCP